MVRTSLLGTDGCCLLDPLTFKLSSSVHGVAGQCLVRTSLVAAYWIRFPSSWLRLFMELRRNAWYGRHWLLHIGFAFLQVVFACLEFRGKAWYGRHWLVLLNSLPFKLSSSVHGFQGNAWYGRHWLLLVRCASLSSCLRLFTEFRGNAWYGHHWLLLIGFASLQVVFVCSLSFGAVLGTVFLVVLRRPP